MRPWTHPAAAPPQLPSARSWASLDEARRASDDLLVALLEDIPTSTGSRQIDAFISALAEHIALERGVKPPAWTQDRDRFLDQWWFRPASAPCMRWRWSRVPPPSGDGGSSSQPGRSNGADCSADHGRIRELAEVLAGRDIRGDLFVVGGAAMAVAYQARTATKDVDAVFVPKTQVYDAAEVVAAELGLPDGWLNDAVKVFVTRVDPEAIPVLDRPALRITVASPRFLLAMKLLAGRTEQDADDIRFLAGLLRLTRSDEVLDVVTGVYPEAHILPRTRFLVEEPFGPTTGETLSPDA